MALQGQFFAICCTMCWAATALSFSYAGRRVGSLPVNIIRMFWAMLFFGSLSWWRIGNALPVDANAHQWTWMALSGLIGFFFGDLFLFRAFVEIGTRLAMLIMSLAPVAAALIAWLWLGEDLTVLKLIGMAVALSGVALVVLEKPAESIREIPEQHSINHSGSPRWRGMAFAGLGALGQGTGAVLAKIGMAGSFEELPAMLAGQSDPLDAFRRPISEPWWRWVGSCCYPRMRRNAKIWAARKDRKAMRAILLGAILGPFAGASLFNLSLQHVATGVTQTIVSTLPVVILPFSIWVEREKNLRQRVRMRCKWGITLVQNSRLKRDSLGALWHL